MSISGVGSEASAGDPSAKSASRAPARSWLRRLAIILFVGFGLALWKDGRLFPHEREITWLTPHDRSRISKIEIQILNFDREVLKREQFFFRDGAPSLLVQKVALRNGDYKAIIFVGRVGETEAEASERTLRISNEDLFTFPLVNSNVTTAPRAIH